MKYTLIFVFLLPTLLFAEPSRNTSQGEFSAEVTIPQSSLDLFSKISVQLVLTYPDQYRINIDDLKANLLQYSAILPAPFTLISSDSQIQKLSDNRSQQKLEFVLQPQLIGDFPITFRNITFFKDDKKAEEIISDIFSIHVESLPVGSAFEIEVGPLLPLSPHFPITMSSQNQQLQEESSKQSALVNQQIFRDKSFPWLELLLIALVSLFLWVAFKFRDQKSAAIAEQNQKEQLRQRVIKIIEGWKVEPSSKSNFESYVTLTDALRKFVELKFQMNAPSLTTEEFLQMMTTQSDFSIQDRQKFAQFLSSADLVKFAHYQPTREEWEQVIGVAEKLVGARSRESGARSQETLRD
jgi:hypothetical protein